MDDGVITLRPLALSDRDALFTAASDAEIWAQHPAHDRWQRPVFDGFFDEAMVHGTAFVVIDKASGAMIGSSRYGLERAGPGEVEIGWTFLTREFWGGDTNRRMKRLMLEYALKHFDRVIFLIGETNIRSRRAMEKIGGILTERTYSVDTPGGSINHVIYAIDRQNFTGGPLG